MPSLGVPRNGLPLEFGSSTPLTGASLIGITLNDGMIEDMIECVRNGKDIEISLGANPTLSYGSSTSLFSRTADPFAYDFYQKSVPTGSSPGSSDTVSQPVARGPRKNNIKMAHLGKSSIFLEPKKPARQATTTSAAKQKLQPVSDDAVQNLKDGLAAAKAWKEANTTQFRSSSDLPPAVQRKGPAVNARNGRQPPFNAAKSMHARTNSGSLAVSPDLPPVATASEVRAEKGKLARKPLIHRLAVGPASKDELLALKPDVCTDAEYFEAMGKVADYDESTKKYTVNHKSLRELDVYSYDYKDDTERQKAIDAAIKAYDKMRLTRSDATWDRLNPPNERGQGKCLSSIQAKLADGAFTLRRNPVAESVQGSGDDLDEDGLVADPERGASKKSQSNARAKAAQEKRLSGKATAKSKAASKKEISPKKPVAKKAAAKSTQFVDDAEEADDDYLIDQPPQKSKTVAGKAAPAAEKNRQGIKRKADRDDSGSAPTKRQATIARTSNKDSKAATSASVSGNAGTAQRKTNNPPVLKNTSPQKSSPLASSPPTNASDMDGIDNKSTTATPPPVTKKRKTADSDAGQQPQRKMIKAMKATEAELNGVYDVSHFQNLAIPPEIVDDCRKWVARYEEKYVPLWKKLEAMDSDARPVRDLERLIKLEDELREKKAELIDASRDR